MTLEGITLALEGDRVSATAHRLGVSNNEAKKRLNKRPAPSPDPISVQRGSPVEGTGRGARKPKSGN